MFLDQTISFLELQSKSEQLSFYLSNQGVKKGDRIGIYMPRCLETSIAIYGILKAGAVYVPLDPFSPITRTEFVINDCGIKHIITTPQQTRKLKTLNESLKLTSVVGIEKELPNGIAIPWEYIFNLNIENYTAVNILGDDLAYILYTSGSTGMPKGIMHTHNSALAFVKLVTDLYPMEDAIYGMHAPLHFDPSVQGYFAAPYALATTIIVSDAHTKMPASLAELIEKEKITIWFSVPLALIQMLTHGGIEQRDMSHLKWVLFSGEVFTTKHLRSLMKLWPFAKFSNIYGPTETNQCTNYNLETPPEGDVTIPIGYAWGNTEYKILDTQDQEVGKGEQGELVVRTATMMKGYWNNPELTQKSFYIEIPIAGVEQVYYRTGDQVQQGEKGQLLFFGRNDNQVKLRGYRIELGEVENVLNSHPKVRESVAIVLLNTETNEKELLVSILPFKNEEVMVENLKQFCKNKLPVYALPDTIQILTEFPRTASGKINRKQIEIIITSQ
jgi:amino acid adenylation domain-containing protein